MSLSQEQDRLINYSLEGLSYSDVYRRLLCIHFSPGLLGLDLCNGRKVYDKFNFPCVNRYPRDCLWFSIGKSATPKMQ